MSDLRVSDLQVSDLQVSDLPVSDSEVTDFKGTTWECRFFCATNHNSASSIFDTCCDRLVLIDYFPVRPGQHQNLQLLHMMPVSC